MLNGELLREQNQGASKTSRAYLIDLIVTRAKIWRRRKRHGLNDAGNFARQLLQWKLESACPPNLRSAALRASSYSSAENFLERGCGCGNRKTIRNHIADFETGLSQRAASNAYRLLRGQIVADVFRRNCLTCGRFSAGCLKDNLCRQGILFSFAHNLLSEHVEFRIKITACRLVRKTVPSQSCGLRWMVGLPRRGSAYRET